MRMPGTCGKFPTRDAFSSGLFGATAERESFSVIELCQGCAFDHHFDAIGKASATDRARWRRIWKEPNIDVVHVRGFQHAVQYHAHLDDFFERRSRALQQLSEVRQDRPSFAGCRSLQALAG